MSFPTRDPLHGFVSSDVNSHALALHLKIKILSLFVVNVPERTPAGFSRAKPPPFRRLCRHLVAVPKFDPK